MAASSAQTTNGPYKMMAFALLLILCSGAMAQEAEAETEAPAMAEGYIRGDMIPRTTVAPDTDDPQGQVPVLPSLEPTDNNESTPGAAVTEAAPEEGGDEGADFTVQIITEKPMVVEPPARGDGIPKPVPQDDVVCVGKEAVQDKNAVSLKLRAVSNCEDTKMKIQSVLKELCGEDCKLQLYQEDNTDEILVSGQYVEDDVGGMANKFDNVNIKDKTNVEEAVPRWGKNSKLVLVSLLLAGLLLAALLVAGYYLKTHRKNSKGVRLAESFQVDEENQANTLVSVAPLPQEPLDKPTANGESPPENGTNPAAAPAPTPAPAPTTNGHSAAQTPVADTEM